MSVFQHPLAVPTCRGRPDYVVAVRKAQMFLTSLLIRHRRDRQSDEGSLADELHAQVVMRTAEYLW